MTIPPNYVTIYDSNSLEQIKQNQANQQEHRPHQPQSSPRVSQACLNSPMTTSRLLGQMTAQPLPSSSSWVLSTPFRWCSASIKHHPQAEFFDKLHAVSLHKMVNCIRSTVDSHHLGRLEHLKIFKNKLSLAESIKVLILTKK